MSIVGRLRAYWNRQWFEPTLLSVATNPAYIIRRGLFLAIKELAPRISGVVLDFGCGSKPYESLFSEATSYVGVDLEITGHNHADSRVDVFYDGKVLPFMDGQFDAVVSFEVFEHIFNLPQVLREINRVTRDSGYLLVSVPFAWHEHEQPYDFARYTSFGIAHLLTERGYEILSIKKTTTHVLATLQMFIAYLTLLTPRARALRYFQQLCVIFPCTVAAFALDALLPEKYEYFCNTVLLARKVSSQAQNQ